MKIHTSAERKASHLPPSLILPPSFVCASVFLGVCML